MLKKLLIQWVIDLNDKVFSLGQSGLLSKEMGDLMSGLYGYIETIMTSVAMPVAYVILALFCVTELYKASVKIDGAGGGSSLGAEMVFKVMFRMVLCKVAVDSSKLLMEAIYGVSLTLTRGVGSVFGKVPGDVSMGGLDIDAITAEINNLGTGEQMGKFVELLIVRLVVWFVMGMINVICVGRIIEIYVFVAVSPIPIATLPSDELNGIAKNFLKSFAGVCLHGFFIYMVLTFFPTIFAANLFAEEGIWSMVLYSLVLAVAVFGSGKWAKSICNAM